MKRHDAYLRLAELRKTIYQAADVSYVKSKMANLLTILKKERKKIKNSQKSGAAGDDVYVPQLWYFESLQFLCEQVEARPSISNLSLPINNVESVSPMRDRFEEHSTCRV